jgi:thiol-disulfide isomerase/thioredoxin
MSDNKGVAIPILPLALGVGILVGAAIAALYLLGAGRGTAPINMPGAAADPSDDRVFTPEPPRPMPELHFVEEAGKAGLLAQFRGKLVLLNIWATWCVPCRSEMPTLDRLQAKLGGPNFEVVALSIDGGGASAVRQFFQTLGVRSLGIYVDTSGEAAVALHSLGVPTTVLIDREGREIGRKIGAAVWDSDEVVRVIRSSMATRS